MPLPTKSQAGKVPLKNYAHLLGSAPPLWPPVSPPSNLLPPRPKSESSLYPPNKAAKAVSSRPSSHLPGIKETKSQGSSNASKPPTDLKADSNPEAPGAKKSKDEKQKEKEAKNPEYLGLDRVTRHGLQGYKGTSGNIILAFMVRNPGLSWREAQTRLHLAVISGHAEIVEFGVIWHTLFVPDF